jgi:glutathione S-transferase
MSGESTYKLIYFNTKGRAEPIRLIFAYKGVRFQDYRLKEGEFPQLKSTFPFGQVPVLEVDGHPLAQSMTICRYLGRKFGLAGINDWESAQCDMYADGLNDLYTGLPAWFQEKDPEKKKAKWTEFMESKMKPFLSRYDGFLEKKGNRHLVGDKITWADIVIYSGIDFLSELGKEEGMVDGHPHLKAMMDMVASQENIKQWIKDHNN